MMKLHQHQTRKKFKPYFSPALTALSVLLLNTYAYAENIAIKETRLIDKPVKYNHDTLHMDAGFMIQGNGSIDIENSIVYVTISPSNPFFAKLNNGTMNLKNNKFYVTTSGITPNPTTQSYQLLQVEKGNVIIKENKFTIDKSFTVGVLGTKNQENTNFKISGNSFFNFHGGLYILNTKNVDINENFFNQVSLSNIYFNGSDANFENNMFLFPGNLNQGNAFDIINADKVKISNNIITSSSNYGILLSGVTNTIIDNNKITDGLSYGIFIQPPVLNQNKNDYLSKFASKNTTDLKPNRNLTISNNYIEQNRYGLSGGPVNKLTARNNIFIQRFADSSSRKYWTNNDVLLPAVTNLIWQNNLYKEAFTQEVPGDNSLSLKFVPFPEHGGVSLP